MEIRTFIHLPNRSAGTLSDFENKVETIKAALDACITKYVKAKRNYTNVVSGLLCVRRYATNYADYKKRNWWLSQNSSTPYFGKNMHVFDPTRITSVEFSLFYAKRGEVGKPANCFRIGIEQQHFTKYSSEFETFHIDDDIQPIIAKIEQIIQRTFY